MSKTITATLVFIDVVGSSKLRRGRGEAAAQKALNALKDLIRRQVEEQGGRVANTAGDGLLLGFESARAAVNCAIAIQQEVGEHRHPGPGSMPPVRIGINIGEVIEEGGDLFGLPVDAAEHIQSKAKGGQILASELVRGVVGMAEDVQFEERGRYSLKNFPGRWRLYEVPWQRHAAKKEALMCALLVSDFAGTAGMYERLGDEGGLEVLRAYHAIVRANMDFQSLFWSKVFADTSILAFRSSGPALACAIAMRKAFAAHNHEHSGEPMRVRIGLHVGEVIQEADDLFGRAVNFAVRIGGIAGVGEIVASSHLKELTEPDEEVRFRKRADVELTGFQGKHRIYLVLGRK